jgi:dinuclear metal center YbgI/SA1388 family protein
VSRPQKGGTLFYGKMTKFITFSDIQRIIETWAPKNIAWERDNIGLQVGSPKSRATRILACLDVTERIIHEASTRSANLIISHHPLLFRPLRNVDTQEHTGRCLDLLVRSGIGLFSAHTNLDFAHGGTSFALAKKLHLVRTDFLSKNYRLSKKIVTFVPESHVERVAAAMGSAGAGRIGNYQSCSFRSQGTGTFQGDKYSNPQIGRKEQLEHVLEVRLEMITEEPDISSVVNALKQVHPYEEIAYDIYPLENASHGFGMGVIGDLPKPMSVRQFILHTKQRLRTRSIRHTPFSAKRIRRVAVCGGSGTELTAEAIRQEADAFVTADVKYHNFQDALGRILLIDAGHYETERPVIDVLVKKLTEEFERGGISIPIVAARTSSNPIVYN